MPNTMWERLVFCCCSKGGGAFGTSGVFFCSDIGRGEGAVLSDRCVVVIIMGEG